MKLHYMNYTLFLHIEHVSLYCQHLASGDRTESFFLAFLSFFCFQIVIFTGGHRASLKANPAYGDLPSCFLSWFPRQRLHHQACCFGLFIPSSKTDLIWTETMCLVPHLQAVEMLIKAIMLQRQGNPNPGPSAVVSTEMRKHSSVRGLHFLAEGLSMKTDRKSNFLMLSQKRNTSFPLGKPRRQTDVLGEAL